MVLSAVRISGGKAEQEDGKRRLELETRYRTEDDEEVEMGCLARFVR